MLMEMGFMGILKVNPAIIITLLVFSVIMLAFFLERGWVYLKLGSWNNKFWEKLRNAVQAGRLHEARAMCSQSENVYAKVFFTAISNTHLTRADNEDMVQIAKEHGQEVLRKRLGIFATFSFVSPLIGLLGTVTGIMQAFHDLAKSGSGGANIVAAGISEALIATAMGIVVAVPSAVFYNIFTYKLRGVVSKMNNYAQEVIILIYGGEPVGEKPVQPKASEIRAKTSH
jgi:biopolymer transport protein ExbB